MDFTLWDLSPRKRSVSKVHDKSSGDIFVSNDTHECGRNPVNT